MESTLILKGVGLPPLSARGCTQYLRPIETGVLRRTINGSLIYAGNTLSHKYRSTIFCEDKASLALEGLWRGSQVKVGCIQHLWSQGDEQEVLLERDPVEGSIFALADSQESIAIESVAGRKVFLSNQVSGMVFVAYCPWLEMRIITFSFMTNEWGLKVGWRLELEEV